MYMRRQMCMLNSCNDRPDMPQSIHCHKTFESKRMLELLLDWHHKLNNWYLMLRRSYTCNYRQNTVRLILNCSICPCIYNLQRHLLPET
jgi:hypothetical protein